MSITPKAYKFLNSDLKFESCHKDKIVSCQATTNAYENICQHFTNYACH